MVCDRCKTTVMSKLDKLKIQYNSVELGEVNTTSKLTNLQVIQLGKALKLSGFELIDDKKNVLIEKIKKAIINLGNYSDNDLKTSYSDFISISVDENFITLDTLFSEIEGFSIKKYTVKHKVELVKELLILNNFNLSEIVIKMHYLNKAQLSRQFKSITGLTPTHFRQLRQVTGINPAYN